MPYFLYSSSVLESTAEKESYKMQCEFYESFITVPYCLCREVRGCRPEMSSGSTATAAGR
jgi:hypothetical protein